MLWKIFISLRGIAWKMQRKIIEVLFSLEEARWYNPGKITSQKLDIEVEEPQGYIKPTSIHWYTDVELKSHNLQWTITNHHTLHPSSGGRTQGCISPTLVHCYTDVGLKSHTLQWTRKWLHGKELPTCARVKATQCGAIEDDGCGVWWFVMVHCKVWDLSPTLMQQCTNVGFI